MQDPASQLQLSKGTIVGEGVLLVPVAVGLVHAWADDMALGIATVMAAQYQSLVMSQWDKLAKEVVHEPGVASSKGSMQQCTHMYSQIAESPEIWNVGSELLRQCSKA